MPNRHHITQTTSKKCTLFESGLVTNFQKIKNAFYWLYFQKLGSLNSNGKMRLYRTNFADYALSFFKTFRARCFLFYFILIISLFFSF